LNFRLSHSACFSLVTLRLSLVTRGIFFSDFLAVFPKPSRPAPTLFLCLSPGLRRRVLSFFFSDEISKIERLPPRRRRFEFPSARSSPVACFSLNCCFRSRSPQFPPRRLFLEVNLLLFGTPGSGKAPEVPVTASSRKDLFSPSFRVEKKPRPFFCFFFGQAARVFHDWVLLIFCTVCTYFFHRVTPPGISSSAPWRFF